MVLTRRAALQLLASAAVLAASLVFAQTAPTTSSAISPPFTSPAAVYSGISGPGKPVTGSGAEMVGSSAGPSCLCRLATPIAAHSIAIAPARQANNCQRGAGL